MNNQRPEFDDDPQVFTDKLLDWFGQYGDHRYDESVTQLEHALQCAHLASEADAGAAEVVAALLHDVGHVLMHEQIHAGRGQARDLRHEVVGANWLARAFPPAVHAPVRLHVPAKRYLCATDERYWATLSDGSKRSLELQGGPMSSEECDRFTAEPFWREALALRRRDEQSKDVDATVPALSRYRELIAKVMSENLPQTL